MSNELIYEQLLGILRCPITTRSLRLLSKSEMRDLNARVSKGELFHSDRTLVKTTIEAGFISADGQYAYPIIDGIIVLLAHLSIPVADPDGDSSLSLRAEKKILQDFYDQVGWLKGEENTSQYVDAIKWEDLRPVVSEYTHRCHLRVNRYIQNLGQYFLDAGSGPIQYDEYLTYSQGYNYRICVDISLLALTEAKKKLGDRGIYILGDIANIPLQDNVVDGAVSLHTIYHVPADEQINAFRELYRTIKPGTSAAVVYSWSNSSLMKVFLFPRRVQKIFRNFIGKVKSVIKKIIRWKSKSQVVVKSSAPENPYHHTFDYRYITEQLADLNIAIFPWRSVGVPFMKIYIRPKFFGKKIMDWVYNFEEKSPSLAARIGQYPIVVLSKK
jgi:SAM-dependent methyltransferase/uncharacterized protein YbaR (Trm112 family)